MERPLSLYPPPASWPAEIKTLGSRKRGDYKAYYIDRRGVSHTAATVEELRPLLEADLADHAAWEEHLRRAATLVEQGVYLLEKDVLAGVIRPVTPVAMVAVRLHWGGTAAVLYCEDTGGSPVSDEIDSPTLWGLAPEQQYEIRCSLPEWFGEEIMEPRPDPRWDGSDEWDYLWDNETPHRLTPTVPTGRYRITGRGE